MKKERQNPVIERIRQIKKSENLTNKTFSDRLNLSEETIKSMFSKKTSPNVETILKIKSAFPLYSLDWVLAGLGEMLLSESQSTEYKEKYYDILEQLTDAQNKIISLQDELLQSKKFAVSTTSDAKTALQQIGT